MYMSNPENQPLTHKSSINSYAQNVHDVHLVSHEMDLGESMLDSDPDSIDDDIFRDEDVFSSDSEEDGLFSREKHSYSVLEQRSKVGSTSRTNRQVSAPTMKSMRSRTTMKSAAAMSIYSRASKITRTDAKLIASQQKAEKAGDGD